MGKNKQTKNLKKVCGKTYFVKALGKNSFKIGNLFLDDDFFGINEKNSLAKLE